MLAAGEVDGIIFYQIIWHEWGSIEDFERVILQHMFFTSAHLTICTSGIILFLFIYFLQEFSQTLSFFLSQKISVPLTTY